MTEPGIWRFTFDGVVRIEDAAYGQATIALEIKHPYAPELIVKARSYVEPGMQFNKKIFVPEPGPKTGPGDVMSGVLRHIKTCTGAGNITSHRLHEYEVKQEGNGPVAPASSY